MEALQQDTKDAPLQKIYELKEGKRKKKKKNNPSRVSNANPEL